MSEKVSRLSCEKCGTEGQLRVYERAWTRYTPTLRRGEVILEAPYKQVEEEVEYEFHCMNCAADYPVPDWVVGKFRLDKASPRHDELKLCSECGSDEVSVGAIYRINDRDVYGWDDREVWCSSCETHTDLTTLKNLLFIVQDADLDSSSVIVRCAEPLCRDAEYDVDRYIECIDEWAMLEFGGIWSVGCIKSIDLAEERQLLKESMRMYVHADDEFKPCGTYVPGIIARIGHG